MAGMAVLCLLAAWEWLKRVWDQLDAWWAGSQASSRRARRLRRMQRAIEDELAAQRQAMRLDDVPAAASAADSGVLSTRPPRGESVPSQSSQPTRPSQPAVSSSGSRPATLARSPAVQPPRRPLVREQSTQTDRESAFRLLTETEASPDPPRPRIEIHTQYELPQRPYNFTAHGECVHLDQGCWGLRRNTRLTSRNLCRVCSDNYRRGLY